MIKLELLYDNKICNTIYVSIFRRKRTRCFEIFIPLILIQSTVLGIDASPEGECIFLIEKFEFNIFIKYLLL